MVDDAATKQSLDTIRDDINALKSEVARLLTRLRDDAVSGASTQAREIYDTLAAEGENQMNNLSNCVQERPIASILIAFGLGFLGGRVLLR